MTGRLVEKPGRLIHFVPAGQNVTHCGKPLSSGVWRDVDPGA